MAVRFGGTGSGAAGPTTLSIGVTGITGGTDGRLLFQGPGVVLTDSALFTYGDTLVSSGPGVKIGSTGTNAGAQLGYYGVSGFGALWPSTVTPNTVNYAIGFGSGETYLMGGKVAVTSTAGFGMSIGAGTATTDVAALAITRTNNNAAVATGVKFTFTDTTSAAGFLPFQVLGGTGAVTNLLSVGKTGILTVGDVLVLKGYAIASLPAGGPDGAIAMVTDQVTAVAAKGVAPTAGGAIHCAVIYNGSAWVGI